MATRPIPPRGQPVGALLIVASIFGFAWAFHLVTVRPAPLASRAQYGWSAYGFAIAEPPNTLLESEGFSPRLLSPRSVSPNSAIPRATSGPALVRLAAASEEPVVHDSRSHDSPLYARVERTQEAAPLAAQAWAPATLPPPIAPSGVDAPPGGPAHAVSRAFVRTGSAIGLAFRKTTAGIKTAF